MTGSMFSELPRGELAWEEMIAYLADTDDRLERHFLELKSAIELNSEEGRAKVAKFVLGAANRDPVVAARYLGGHAIMVLGVARSSVTGIRPFEAHELSRAVTRFIGANGPKWDFIRIPVDNDRDVIAIVVNPPDGHTWTCRKDGPNGLKDGGIYVRADGETRAAKGDEIRAMLERERLGQAAGEFEVTVEGSAASLDNSAEDVLSDYIAHHRERLMNAYRRATQGTAGDFGQLAAMALKLQSSAYQPERRSDEQYRAEIDAWVTATEQAWPTILDAAVGSIGVSSSIQIRNLSDVFAEDAEVKIHIEGPIEAVRARADLDAQRHLPSLPREWGPRPPAFLNTVQRPIIGSPSAYNFPSNRISFKNGGSTTLVLNLETMRPRVVHKVDGDIVLVARDRSINKFQGRWQITIRGHHRVYEGDLAVPAQEIDVMTPLRRVLLPDVE